MAKDINEYKLWCEKHGLKPCQVDNLHAYIQEQKARPTPIIKHYEEVKKGYANALLFIRVGDFYEALFEDAVTAAKALDLTLTHRYSDEGSVPMCGMPATSLKLYLTTLIELGYKVAIAETLQEVRND